MRRFIYIIHGLQSCISKSKICRKEKVRKIKTCEYVSVMVSRISGYCSFSFNDLLAFQCNADWYSARHLTVSEILPLSSKNMPCLAPKIPCGALREFPPPDEADSALPDSKKTSMTRSTSQVHSCPLTTLVSQDCLFRHKSRNLLTSMLALFCSLPAHSPCTHRGSKLDEDVLTTTGTSADSELSEDVF